MPLTAIVRWILQAVCRTSLRTSGSPNGLRAIPRKRDLRKESLRDPICHCWKSAREYAPTHSAFEMCAFLTCKPH